MRFWDVNIRKKALDVFTNMDTDDLMDAMSYIPKEKLPKNEVSQLMHFIERDEVQRAKDYPGGSDDLLSHISEKFWTTVRRILTRRCGLPAQVHAELPRVTPTKVTKRAVILDESRARQWK